MRTRVTAVATALILAAALLGVLAWTGRAQDANPYTLYVSGMSIGKSRTAIVRVTNGSPVRGDAQRIFFTVRNTVNGAPLTLPGAGDGAQLFPGDTLELDLGRLVAAYRAQTGLPSFEGTVQFVAFGSGGPIHPFGPRYTAVQAIQTERKAVYAANVEWRPVELPQ